MSALWLPKVDAIVPKSAMMGTCVTNRIAEACALGGDGAGGAGGGGGGEGGGGEGGGAGGTGVLVGGESGPPDVGESLEPAPHDATITASASHWTRETSFMIFGPPVPARVARDLTTWIDTSDRRGAGQVTRSASCAVHEIGPRAFSAKGKACRHAAKTGR
jgi:hypothetical protein